MGYAGRGVPSNGNRLMASRPAYGAMREEASRGGNRGSDQVRNGFDARRRSFDHWYFYSYPNWLGYGFPYLVNPWLWPGTYDWWDSDDAANGQIAPAADYGAPYPDQTPGQGYPGDLPPWSAPEEQDGGMAVASAPLVEEPLTVIFKSGRASMRMQNYMVTAKVLTDLDSRHYEQIPLDQIDVAATRRVNGEAGVEFQVPIASRD
jgi:hypothetical protein